MIELGGTIGDIESMPFIEALRSLKFQLPEKLGLNCWTGSNALTDQQNRTAVLQWSS